MVLSLLLTRACAAAGFEPGDQPAPHVLGLLLHSGNARQTAARELERGVRLALEQYQKPRGRPVQLAVAPRADKWSAGTTGLVHLVYEQHAVAVIGPADGQTGHVAEQVVARAKGRFLLLTPWATDPTLTRIKVPWFFRLAHDDRAQAEALCRAIYSARRLSRVTVLAASDDYDSRVAAEAFLRVAGDRAPSPPARVNVDTKSRAGGPAPQPIPASLKRAQAVLLYLPPPAAAQWLRRLRAAGLSTQCFGPLWLACPAFLTVAGQAAEGMVLAAPAPPADGPAAHRFRAAYRRHYGQPPTVPAAYGYDAATVLLQAISAGNSPLSTKQLQANLAATDHLGLTGRIRFDPSGNRTSPCPLSLIRNARLQPVRKR